MTEEKKFRRYCFFHINCPRVDDPTHQQYFICDYKKPCYGGLRCLKQKSHKGWSQEEADKHNRFFAHVNDSDARRAERSRIRTEKVIVKAEETYKVMWKYELVALDVYGTLYNIDSTIESTELVSDELLNMKTKMIKYLLNKHANGNAFTDFKITIETV